MALANNSAFDDKALDKCVTTQDGTPTPLKKWWQGNYLTGDWFGARTALENYGIRPFGALDSELSWNPYGGAKEGGLANTAELSFGVEFDLEKLAGWQGSSFYTRGVYRTGDDLTKEYVGNWYNTQQNSSGPVTNGRSNLWLQAFYFQQKFLKGKNLIMKVGRMATCDDFARSPIYGLYQNHGIDSSLQNIKSTGVFFASPGSAWAGNIQYIDPNKQWYGKLGLYQSDNRAQNTLTGDHGLDWGIRDGDGITCITEWGWTPEFNKQSVTIYDSKGKPHTEMRGMPGHYWIGGYVSNLTVPEYGKDSNQPIGSRDFSYCIYLNADQMVYQAVPGTDLGLTLWAAFCYTGPDDVSVAPYQVEGGAFYKGLIPSRDNDILMLGVAWGDFSDYNCYAPPSWTNSTEKPKAETMIELGYRVQLSKFWYLQPNLQYILDPSGVGDIPDALVVGCRIGLTF